MREGLLGLIFASKRTNKSSIRERDRGRRRRGDHRLGSRNRDVWSRMIDGGVKEASDSRDRRRSAQVLRARRGSFSTINSSEPLD